MFANPSSQPLPSEPEAGGNNEQDDDRQDAADSASPYTTRMLQYIQRHSALIGFLGFALGIVGLALSIYFYVDARQYVELTYATSTVKIVESDDVTPSLNITDKYGKKISSDVFVSEVTLWNSGTLPIEHDIVRKPVTIRIGGGLSIVDARIAAQTHPDISGFLLKETEDEFVRQVNWKYFDPNFGLKILLITAGPHEPTIDMEGHILGFKDFVKGSARQPQTAGSNRRVIALIMGVFIILLVGSWLAQVIRAFFVNVLPDRTASITIKVMTSMFILVIVAAFVYTVWVVAMTFTIRYPPL